MRVHSKRVLAISMAVFMVFSMVAGVVRPEVASAAPYDITEYPIPTVGFGAPVAAAAVEVVASAA